MKNTNKYKGRKTSQHACVHKKRRDKKKKIKTSYVMETPPARLSTMSIHAQHLWAAVRIINWADFIYRPTLHPP